MSTPGNHLSRHLRLSMKSTKQTSVSCIFSRGGSEIPCDLGLCWKRLPGPRGRTVFVATSLGLSLVKMMTLSLDFWFFFQGHSSQHWGEWDFNPPYLSHGVVLHSYFPEEEVDVVSIIHCLDKVRLYGQMAF